MIRHASECDETMTPEARLRSTNMWDSLHCGPPYDLRGNKNQNQRGRQETRRTTPIFSSLAGIRKSDRNDQVKLEEP